MSKLKLEVKHIAPYLPYGLKGVLIRDIRDTFTDEEWCRDVENFNKGVIWDYAGYVDEDLELPLGEGEFSGFLIRKEYAYTSADYDVKPILRPLSDLLNEIEVDGEKIIPIEWFEIGDEDNNSNEYDFGNIRIIRSLKSLAKNGSLNDIIFLPYGLIQKLIEWHFDIFGLIEKGLAIDINTLNEYKNEQL